MDQREKYINKLGIDKVFTTKDCSRKAGKDWFKTKNKKSNDVTLNMMTENVLDND